MGKRCAWAALAVTAFFLCFGRTEKPCEASTIQKTEVTDLTETFAVILQGATREFAAGYALDESFFIWLDAVYGDDAVLQLADLVSTGQTEPEGWHTVTGSSIHVLWMQYCRDAGYQNRKLDWVHWRECAGTGETVLSFTGDFNLAEGWCTTEYMKQQPEGIADCFSAPLLSLMRESDILVMNNEFVYSDRGEPLAGKAYTFRAKPEMVEHLSWFGADLVTLSNNHTFDYGEEGLLDTFAYLKEAGILYSGAGQNLEEASGIVSFIANGRKISIVSATEIERSIQYTRQATASEAGVLKTLQPEYFTEVIRKAKARSDYTIVVCHWGTEGNLLPDTVQMDLAGRFVEAGADAIIGGHPHRLQGAEFIDGVPVAYSIGNFWFSDATLYTTVAQIILGEDGTLTLRYLPCIQKDLTTSLITDKTEKEEFYHYLASISGQVGIDAEGNVYDKSAADYPAGQILYDPDTSTTAIWGGIDNEGNAIDIVGNRK
ncbi:MAG: CapA family protein [Roseburia sp.]